MFRRLPQIAPRFPLLPVASCALLLLLSMPGLARDKNAFLNDVPPPPPEPNPLEVEVPRGGPVWITLSAYSLTSPIIRYRIRRQARDGHLGTPQVISADTGRVKYTPPEGSGPTDDNFSYQVQSEGGVSAAAEVHIKITDKDPQLIAPDELDFGDVLPGESARRVLVLQNIGGGIAQGDVRVPEGWGVEGDPAYRIGAGAKQSFTLVFTPAEQREYTGDIEYTGDLDRATDLVGKEVPPVLVAADMVELLEAGNMRMGAVHVENRSDTARTLRVIPGPDLQADPTVNLPAKGAADILVQAKPGEGGEIRDEVTIEGEGIKASVPVHAAAIQRLAPGAMSVVHASAAPSVSPRVAATLGPVSTQTVAVVPDAAQPDVALPPLVSAPESPVSVTTVSALGVKILSPNAVRLGCTFKNASPLAYRLEAQTVGLDARGMPMAKWVPAGNSTVVVNGQSVTADLSDLSPGTLHVVRLVGMDPQGRIVALSSTRQIWTEAAQPAYWRWILLAVVVLSAGAGGAWFWRKHSIR